ncbi:extracellular protease inhibitor 1-like [Penaeus chinensis]|uniref:extracellular protease inhibitor 1-like n=1 Tax=Penaeus chinensis TaxID=139456 RepID=UPI001FB8370C|nr:extracellular protease inhibitor 1-like [Penaeus chinensis]
MAGENPYVILTLLLLLQALSHAWGPSSASDRKPGGPAKHPQRLCPPTCPWDYTPVCGSDGTTYYNECALERIKCSDLTLFKVNNGPCRVASSRRPCPTACPFEFLPVCGTDGTSYHSECALAAARCSKPGLAKRSNGPCPLSDSWGPRAPDKPSWSAPSVPSSGTGYDAPRMGPSPINEVQKKPWKR